MGETAQVKRFEKKCQPRVTFLFTRQARHGGKFFQQHSQFHDSVGFDEHVFSQRVHNFLSQDSLNLLILWAILFVRWPEKIDFFAHPFPLNREKASRILKCRSFFSILLKISIFFEQNFSLSIADRNSYKEISKVVKLMTK